METKRKYCGFLKSPSATIKGIGNISRFPTRNILLFIDRPARIAVGLNL